MWRQKYIKVKYLPNKSEYQPKFAFQIHYSLFTMSFTVAIVGRPNVGKSTLFNRLLEQRKAIVDDVSGVTRDRQYGVTDWNGKTFNVIDTGGFVARSEDVFEIEIAKQVMIAVDEADAIIFMVDAATGMTDLDDSMAAVLRKSTKPVFLTVNRMAITIIIPEHYQDILLLIQ